MSQSGGNDWLTGDFDGVSGVDFIDRCLGPDRSRGQLYGLLGPIGVGKSTLGAMIAVEGAKMAYTRQMAGQSPAQWVYINIDGKASDMQERLISHGAKISRNELGRDWFLKDRSVIGTYRAYETERRAELPHRENVLLGETERLIDFRSRIYGRHLRLMDLDSVEWGQTQPSQSIAEGLEFMALDVQIAGVVIDYVGRAVKDFVDFDFLRIPAETIHFIHECREHIADRWNCPVWLIHQLNGEANLRKPGSVQHHRDAADCKSFGDELDACFVLGQRDHTSGAFLLQCTKSSIQPPEPAILRFDPHFATLRQTDDLRVDRVTKDIMPRRHPIHFDPTFDCLPAADDPV